MEQLYILVSVRFVLVGPKIIRQLGIVLKLLGLVKDISFVLWEPRKIDVALDRGSVWIIILWDNWPIPMDQKVSGTDNKEDQSYKTRSLF